MRLLFCAFMAAFVMCGQAYAATVSFAKIVAQIPPGSSTIVQKTDALCLLGSATRFEQSGVELDPSYFTGAFLQEMRNASIPIVDPASNLFDDSPSAGDLAVGAVLTAVNGKICWGAGLNRLDVGTGSLSMSIEWQVYSTLERQVVARIKTSGEAREGRGKADVLVPLVADAFGANARALAADPEFRKVALAPARSTREALAPTTQLKIALPGSLSAPTQKLAAVSNSIALVLASRGNGSGFLVSSAGHMLTNQHVVGSDRYVKIRWPDGSETIGEVVRTDRRRDVALIKVESSSRPPLPLAPALPELGQSVWAIGTPLDPQFQGTVTRGVVSAPSRDYEGLKYVQSDVTVNPGNSGGPLVDDQGHVVAITVIGYQPVGLPTNINLFIPIGDALAYLSLEPQ